MVADQTTSIACQFTAKCCNDLERYEILNFAFKLFSSEGRRFSEMRGAFIAPEEWELLVSPKKNGTLRVVLKIDSVKLLGHDGENPIGDPRDFNTYRDVLDILSDPKRER